MRRDAFGDAVILILAAAAGVLARQSAAALLAKRRLTAIMVGSHLSRATRLSAGGNAFLRNRVRVSSLAREEPHDCHGERRRCFQESLWRGDDALVGGG